MPLTRLQSLVVWATASLAVVSVIYAPTKGIWSYPAPSFIARADAHERRHTRDFVWLAAHDPVYIHYRTVPDWGRVAGELVLIIGIGVGLTLTLRDRHTTPVRSSSTSFRERAETFFAKCRITIAGLDSVHTSFRQYSGKASAPRDEPESLAAGKIVLRFVVWGIVTGIAVLSVVVVASLPKNESVGKTIPTPTETVKPIGTPASGAWFDVEAARRAGGTDESILAYLNGNGRFDVEGAKKRGLTSGQIIAFLASEPTAGPPGGSSLSPLPPGVGQPAAKPDSRPPVDLEALAAKAGATDYVPTVVADPPAKPASARSPVDLEALARKYGATDYVPAVAADPRPKAPPARAPVSLPTGTDIEPPIGTGKGLLHVTNMSSYDVAVKLKTESETRRHVFVKARDSQAISTVPEGTYELQYQMGVDWDEERLVFRRPVGSSKFPELLLYSETVVDEAPGRRYRQTKTYRVKLRVPVGNIRPEAISDAEFAATGSTRR